MSQWTPWRRTVQGLVAAVFLTLPFLAAAEWTTVHGTLASFALGPVEITEPVAGLAAALAAGVLAATVPLALLLGVVPWIVAGLALGPIFCSWACPWGLLSEGLDRLRFRKGARRTWPPDGFLRLRRPRIVLFAAVLVAGGALAVPLAALVSPPRLITVLPVEAVVLGALSPVTGGLLGALLVLELAGPRRLWCRALCPVGTGFKLLRPPARVPALRLRWHEPECFCPGVPACQSHCAWGIDPRRMTTFDGCTHCFACVDGCPSGALTVAWRPAGRTGGATREPQQEVTHEERRRARA